ncbi:FAD-dependent oxidoreductase [Thermobifida alba]|uniref:FAD-dependent oxidoreductase n=1 Tax=Thermobifida alba TaxID=53522 RepID=A0ABY4L0M9_THEAE|nr:FAD-dependent oxidoreductase [Thermobifida alba]UPT20481.1 FAD-dependent oxidoreductase [Thermobifida alba]
MSDSSHDRRVVVVGAGLSGLATALGAALRGCRVTVFEAAELVGGAAAYSGGQVWVGANHVEEREGVEDSLELTERYVRDIARAAPEVLDEEAMRRWLTVAPQAMRYWEEVGAIRWTIIPGLADYHAEADGALGAGRYLTNEVIDGSVLGEWRDRLRVSPYFPVGTTYAEMFVRGRRVSGSDSEENRSGDEETQGFGLTRAPEEREGAARDGADPLTFGTGVVASFLARVLQERSVVIRTSHPVTELLTDGAGRVVGVRAQGPDGPVEARGDVVLATSTYDWDPDLVRELLDLGPEDFGSIAPRSLRGQGIRLARSVGAGVVRIPPTSVPMLPGWEAGDGAGYAYGPEFAKPHTLIVDRSGRRFCNDSYWVDIVARALDPEDRHLPFFLVWDEQHRRKYGLGTVPPGGEYPPGVVTSAPTLRELGAALGVDGEQLEQTVERFNGYAARGEDPDFGRGGLDYVLRFYGDPKHRPNPVLGTVVEPPFHGMRLRFLGTGIGSSGVHTDGDGHVLDESGRPIPGLYAAGSVTALTSSGSGYNSGFALSRGLTLAYLIACELGGTDG